MALEVAMDEMAEKLGIDPIELRVRNDTQVDPEKPERPFSQRSLVKCLQMGAERFGWSKRNPKPASVRDGGWLIGIGVAAAIRGNPVTKSAARVRLDSHGIVTVETDMTDIGTGSYTIIAQTAAETMGVPLERVVEACSTAPARLFKLDKKGEIRPGFDADLVLVDLEKEYEIRDEDVLSLVGWSPYAGRKVKGKPVRTIVRGRTVYKDGKVVGEKGYGKQAKASASAKVAKAA